VVAHVRLHLRVDLVGGAAQRELAERDEIALAEERQAEQIAALERQDEGADGERADLD